MKKILNSPSQAGQDAFVLNMLGEKKEGVYFEIGAFDPVTISNTYILETEYDWIGVSLDINSSFVDKFNLTRKNHCLAVDATNVNISELLKAVGMPKVIDYLQIDIDPAQQSYTALSHMPFDEYSFAVITFEHDAYDDINNEIIRQDSRDLLLSHGYQLVVANVLTDENEPFEDWYVHPDYVDESIWGPVVCSNVQGLSLFE